MKPTRFGWFILFVSFLFIIACFLSGRAEAQPYAPPVNAPSYVTYTTRALNLYVDGALGNDGATCQGTGANACKTTAGVFKKVPRGIRHPVVITYAAGTYAGGWLENYFIDRSVAPATSAYVQILGTLTNPTPTTGVASGTAASATNAVFTTGVKNTITKTAAGWTVNDFRGMYLVFTSGALNGKYYPIMTNTATVITVGGSFADDGGSPSGATFVIKDIGTKFTSAGFATGPLMFYAGASFDGYYVWFVRNFGASAPDALQFKNIEFNTSGGSQYDIYATQSGITFDHCRFKNTTSAALVVLGPANTMSSYESAFVLHDDFNYGFYTNSDAFVTGNYSGSSQSSLLSVGDIAYSDATNKGYWIIGTGLHIEIFYHYSNNINRAIWVGQSTAIVWNGIFASQTNCITGSYGTGLTGDSTIVVRNAYFDTCTIAAVRGDGKVTISLATTEGGVSNGIGIQADNTAVVQINANSNIGATNEVQVEGTNSTLAALRLLSPAVLAGPKTAARVYQ